MPDPLFSGTRQILADFLDQMSGMTNVELTTYPGARASHLDLVALADEYSAAAETLFPLARRRQPLSRAPARLCAIHAIELYLSAFLIARGSTTEQIRSHLHDLAIRTDLAMEAGLKLRKETSRHLRTMNESREYLVSRYGPEVSARLSEVNRLQATLREVAKKVRLSSAVDQKRTETT